jgi:hypothetical protein
MQQKLIFGHANTVNGHTEAIMIAKITSLFKKFIEHGKVVQMARAQKYIELHSKKGNW